ncbi:MAG: HAMP domain-containing protein [Verrucomicrobiae bacterium]|nr:HAMP domain-containing protein [Verrucomicrobiae bacterium]
MKSKEENSPIRTPGVKERETSSGRGSLTRPLVVLLVAVSVVLAALSYTTQKLVVLRAFDRIERDGALRDLTRCEAGIYRDLELLDNFVNDWAAWDDTCTFIEKPNKEFEDANLIVETYEHGQLNFIGLFNTANDLVWGEGRSTGSLEIIDVSDVCAKISDPLTELTAFRDLNDSRVGVILSKLGPMLIAIRPIITSKQEGPIRGALAMGRLLTPAEISNLAERAQVQLNIWAARDERMPEAGRAMISRSQGEASAPEILSADTKMLHAYDLLPDLFGNPGLVLRVDVPRNVTLQGNFAAGIATATSVIGGILMMVAAAWGIRQRVLVPLQRMAEHAERIGEHGNLKDKLGYARNDEIGVLADAFDGMVAAISETRQQLLTAAHRSGMADVAGEVLHNVGNAVNAANSSLEMLEERASDSKLVGLQKATDLLQSQTHRAAEFFSEDTRGPKLIDYLSKVTQHLQMEFAENRTSLRRLRQTIRHIQGIIAQQQVYSRSSEFTMEVDLAGLINEALDINEYQIKQLNVEVETDAGGISTLSLNRGKLSQVLVNLVRNALEAMQESESSRKLSVVASRLDQACVCIEISDTGAGIPDEIRANLFQQGFTTKPTGNGIGLHFCSNALQSMGGRIDVLSAGSGAGTTFRVSLPDVIVDDDVESTKHQEQVPRQCQEKRKASRVSGMSVAVSAGHPEIPK